MKYHPNIDNKIVDRINQSEEDGGVWLKDVSVGDTIFVKTKNTKYVIKKTEKGFKIEGNKIYCPNPTSCTINGSTWGASMLKIGFIGVGMHMEYYVEGHRGVTTTKIQSVSLPTHPRLGGAP